MDVYDNVSFGLRLRDYPSEEIDRRVERAAEIVQLQGLLDRMPDEMSGGQRQRVAIARAIVREPDVFLMDEPLANLDAKLRVHMRTELQRLHKELDTTIIYVTHDQAEAMTMSDRIAVLDAGELQQIAPPLTCYNEPANLFVAGFIGSPAMNLLEGTVDDTGLPDGALPRRLRPGPAGRRRRRGRTDVRGPTGRHLSGLDERGTRAPVGDDQREDGRLRTDGRRGSSPTSSSGEGRTSMAQEMATSDQLLISVDPDSKIEEDEGHRGGARPPTHSPVRHGHRAGPSRTASLSSPVTRGTPGTPAETDD